MSLRQLPELKAGVSGIRFDLPREALARWTPGIRAADGGDVGVSILDVIGETFDGAGVTAKRIAGVLRAAGKQDVRVDINSPGGDFFEGVAIYNLLRAHAGKVTVRVLGLAASAASIIAMAGDEVQMGDGAFLMIHNAWALAIGNRHDMQAASEQLAPFDAAMADVYAEHTGMTADEAAALMDAETWLGAQAAIDGRFADAVIPRDQITESKAAAGNRRALAMAEYGLTLAGLTRSQRRETLSEITASMPRAADGAMPRAGDVKSAAVAAVAELIAPACAQFTR